MRILITLPVLMFLVTACNRHGADLRRQIAGTWTQGQHTLTLAADGNYTSIFPGAHPVTYKARWRVDHQLLLVTDVRSNSVPIAGDTTLQIVAVDKHNLELQLGNSIILMKR